jgi:hypothetical protein
MGSIYVVIVGNELDDCTVYGPFGSKELAELYISKVDGHNGFQFRVMEMMVGEFG